jgi:hypothetical protein
MIARVWHQDIWLWAREPDGITRPYKADRPFLVKDGKVCARPQLRQRGGSILPRGKGGVPAEQW